jgi:hypothetical protein
MEGLLMSIKIKIGSVITVEAYECIDNSDMCEYAEDEKGIVTGIYRTEELYNDDRISLDESDTLEGISILAIMDYDGAEIEIEEDCYSVVEI